MQHAPSQVVICGAGVIGAAVAYYLSRRGVHATVIERYGVACAASGKSGGFLALDWCDGSPLAALARTSFQLHAELAHSLDTDYGYRRLTTLGVRARVHRQPVSRHPPEEFAWLDGTGVPYAVLELSAPRGPPGTVHQDPVAGSTGMRGAAYGSAASREWNIPPLVCVAYASTVRSSRPTRW